MSKCTCNLQITNLKSSYEFGDKISCSLNVKALKDIKCKEITLNLMTRTHGRGNQNETIFETVILKKGNLNSGNYDFKYDFFITDGTPTYHGTIVNVDWYITARVDIPWAFDVTEEIDFIVTQSKDRVYDSETKTNLLKRSNISFKAPPYFMLLFLIPFSFFAALILYLVKAPFFFNLIFIGFIALFYLFAFYLVIKEWIHSNKFSLLELSVVEQFLKKNETTDVILKVSTKKEVNILNYELRLTGVEIAISGSGTNEVTHRHTIHDKVISNKKIGILRPRQKLIEKTDFTIPSDAPPSFEAPSNYIKWQVEAKMDIDKCPDWNEEKTLFII